MLSDEHVSVSGIANALPIFKGQPGQFLWSDQLDVQM
jgi:hypothetical protein